MLIQEILSNPQETTKISLLYAAKDKSELLFKVWLRHATIALHSTAQHSTVSSASS